MFLSSHYSHTDLVIRLAVPPFPRVLRNCPRLCEYRSAVPRTDRYYIFDFADFCVHHVNSRIREALTVNLQHLVWSRKAAELAAPRLLFRIGWSACDLDNNSRGIRAGPCANKSSSAAVSIFVTPGGSIQIQSNSHQRLRRQNSNEHPVSSPWIFDRYQSPFTLLNPPSSRPINRRSCHKRPIITT